MSNIRQCREEELSTILAIVNGRGAGGKHLARSSGGKSGGKYGDFGGLQGTSNFICISNLLIQKVTRPSSNPSLSANSCLAAVG
jgi:hypothetical protein